MKNTLIACLLLVATALPSMASAAVGGRAGVFGGTYKFENTSSVTQDTNAYGYLLGGTASFEYFFVDLGLEYQHLANDFLDRTDYLGTVGLKLGNFSVFAGYREGHYGDDFNSDDYFKETGPLGGVGASFDLDAVLLSVSVAYNKVDLDPLTTEADGFSARVRAAFSGTPHAVFLRAQKFDGDSPVFTTFTFSEEYVQLGYDYSF